MEVIIFSACIAFVLVEVLSIGKLLKFKPFTCTKCLAGWITAIDIIPEYKQPLYFLGMVCASMCFSILLNAILKRV